MQILNIFKSLTKSISGLQTKASFELLLEREDGQEPIQKIQNASTTKPFPTFQISQNLPFNRGRDRKSPKSCTGASSDSQF